MFSSKFNYEGGDDGTSADNCCDSKDVKTFFFQNKYVGLILRND